MQTLTAEEFAALKNKSRKSVYADVKKFLADMSGDAELKKKLGTNAAVIAVKDIKGVEKIHATTFKKLRDTDGFKIVKIEGPDTYYVTKFGIQL